MLAIRQGLQSVLQIVIYGALLIQTAPRLALATALVSLGHLGVNRLIGGRLRRSAGARMDDLGQLSSKLNETFSAIRAMKAAAIEAYEGGRFLLLRMRRVVSPLAIRLQRMPRRPFVTLPISSLWSGACHCHPGIQKRLVDVSRAHPVHGGCSFYDRADFALRAGVHAPSCSVGVGLVCSRYASPVTRPCRWCSGAKCVLGRTSADCVTFGYTADRPILQDVSVSLRRGELLAIVGASGAGKSTLVDLVLRLHDPQSGQVRSTALMSRIRPGRISKAVRCCVPGKPSVQRHDP